MTRSAAEGRSADPGDRRRWTIAASMSSILAALMASACCIGPLLFAMLGLGGAGLLMQFEPYRPWLVAATVLLLGAGFYVTYRKPRRAASASSDACGCDTPTTKRAGTWMLWLATTATVLLLAAGQVLSSVGDPQQSEVNIAVAHTRTVILTIEGMTCDSCAVSSRVALMRLDGVKDARVSFPEKRAVFTYVPEKVSPQQMVEVINGLGYKASVPPDTSGS